MIGLLMLRSKAQGWVNGNRIIQTRSGHDLLTAHRLGSHTGGGLTENLSGLPHNLQSTTAVVTEVHVMRARGLSRPARIWLPLPPKQLTVVCIWKAIVWKSDYSCIIVVSLHIQTKECKQLNTQLPLHRISCTENVNVLFVVPRFTSVLKAL